MAHSQYLREKARSLRVEQRLTVDQLSERLALPRSTIYYWVRDLPVRLSGSRAAAAPTPGRRRRTRARRSGQPARGRDRRSRKAVYEEALGSYDDLAAQPTFRDFLCVCLAQRCECDQHRIAVVNADPAVVRLAARWIRRLADQAPIFAIEYPADQDLNARRRFWSEIVGTEARAIQVQRGSERSRPAGRSPGSPHGALTVTVDDSLLRARLDAWMHRTRESWL
jgi:transposase-like protein